MFALQRFEAGSIAQLANAVVHNNSAQLLAVADNFTGIAQTYSVPVDSTVTQVTFSISGTTNVTVTRPNGVNLSSSDADVKTIALSSATIYTVTGPGVGVWSITVNGSGLISVGVSAISSLNLNSAKFVEARGRSGHQGLFNIPGFPVIGQDNSVRADLSTTEFQTATLELHSRAGALISSASLTGDSDAANELFGTVTLPDSPFVFYVTGLNSAGEAYQRVIPAIVKTQTVRVTPPKPRDLFPGLKFTYNFQVRNVGATDTFQIKAVDNQKYVLTPNQFVSIASNTTAVISVQMQVPASAAVGTLDTLTFNVSGSTPQASNFAIVKSLVFEKPAVIPPDCSQAVPSSSTLWPPDHKLVALTINGVTDPQGLDLTLNIDSIMQDEPTDDARMRRERGRLRSRCAPSAWAQATDASIMSASQPRILRATPAREP